jgi:hypothetical protein
MLPPAAFAAGDWATMILDIFMCSVESLSVALIYQTICGGPWSDALAVGFYFVVGVVVSYDVLGKIQHMEGVVETYREEEIIFPNELEHY